MSELLVSALRSRSSAERRTAAAVGAAAVPVGCFAIVAGLAATNGGYFPTSWGWSALVLAAAAAIALILRADAELGASTLAWVGAWTALAGWYALSIAWSEAKPESVDEVERILVYVAATAAVAAAVRPERVGRLLGATLAGIAIVAFYSLATRLLPDRIGRFDPSAGYRLSVPVGYWNGLGIFCGIGALLALGFAAHGARAITRAASGAVIVPLITTLYFTYSRGAWLALGIGALALLVVSSRRLALVTTLLLVGPLVAVSVWVASRSDALTHTGVALARAAHDGHRVALLVILLGIAAGIAAAARGYAAERLTIARAVRFAYATTLLIAAVAVLAAVFVRYGDPVALTRKGWDAFAARPVAPGGNLNKRLFNLSSNGRLDLWRAGGADMRAHPWLGSGGGTFESWWYEHRKTTLVVRDAHSLYVETLAELGWPGLALLVLALAIPLVAAVRARRHPLAAAACGAYVAWLAHAGADWDWELAGVTLPALLCAGALVVAGARTPNVTLERVAVRGGGVAFAAVLGVLAFVGLGGNIHLASSASAAGDGRTAASERAARAALRWAPWSADAWRRISEAQTIDGRVSEARASLLKAIAKEPRNWELYVDLAQVTTGAERRAAAAKAGQLNPLDVDVKALASP